MLDLTNEAGLSLTDATKELPSLGGRRLDVSTLWRWCRRGVRGERLEYARLGYRIVTSREALARFAQRLAEADDAEDASSLERQAARCQPPVTKGRTPKQREAAIARARRELAAAGV